MTPIDLGALSRALDVLEHQLRRKGARVIMLVGLRGCVKPMGDTLVVSLREGIIAGDVTRELIDTGLLALDGDLLTIERLPEAAETRALRELLGLHRGSSNWIALVR